MEKIKFAVQIFTLLLAFPLLFISAMINDPHAADLTNAGQDVPAVTRPVVKDKCISRTECYQLRLTTLQPVSKD